MIAKNTDTGLAQQHVRTILESGLLLDEDYEVLLNASNFKIYPTESRPISFGLIASGLATFGSVFLARRYDRPIVLLPPLAVALLMLCVEKRAIQKRKRHRTIVNCVVKSLVKLRKLNAAIIRYMKMRKECSSGSAETKEVLLMYNENVCAFIRELVEKSATYFSFCLEQMGLLADLSQALTEDYRGVKDINVESFLSIDECELLPSRVQDLNTYFSSKYLNYLGLALCHNLTNPHHLLDKNLPCFVAVLDQLTAEVQKGFDDLRYCASKKMEIVTKNRRSFVSGKLQQTLIGAVNNLSLIMEKSQTVLQRVEESAEDGKDPKKLESALGDLRDHAYATYESLDVLCKLYGILADTSNPTHNKKRVIESDKGDENLNANAPATVNYDDSSEALEENYELFIPDTVEEVASFESQQRCEDRSGIYLNLMLKELRQSLKQHERFIAARSKRGIEDDEDDKVVVVPKFDLNAALARGVEDLRKEKNSVPAALGDVDRTLRPVPPPRPSKISQPPPPPPPLPKSRADFVISNEGEGVNESKRTLLDNIKILSTQLKGSEDVFGDDCSSDSD